MTRRRRQPKSAAPTPTALAIPIIQSKICELHGSAVQYRTENDIEQALVNGITALALSQVCDQMVKAYPQYPRESAGQGPSSCPQTKTTRKLQKLVSELKDDWDAYRSSILQFAHIRHAREHLHQPRRQRATPSSTSSSEMIPPTGPASRLTTDPQPMAGQVDATSGFKSTMQRLSGKYPKIMNSIVTFTKDNPDCDKYWFDRVIGLKAVTNALTYGFIYPFQYPGLFPRKSQGILLYGKPGTGKTLTIKAAVNELRARNVIGITFFAPTVSLLKDKFVGGSEKKIKRLFQCAAKVATALARHEQREAISVIFLDEMETVAGDRSKNGGVGSANTSSTVNTLLQMMDGMTSSDNVVVIGATNLRDDIDSAVLRRFDTQIEVDLPDADAIHKHLDLLLETWVSQRPQNYFDETATLTQAAKDLTLFGTVAEPCRRPPIMTESTTWDVKIKKAGGSLRVADIKQFATELAGEHYSGSDVVALFQAAVKVLGAKAMATEAVFEKLDGLWHYKGVQTQQSTTSVKRLDIPATERHLLVNRCMTIHDLRCAKDATPPTAPAP